MLAKKILYNFMLLSSLIAIAFQVDITLTLVGYDHVVAAVDFMCPKIRPGQCCSLAWLDSLAGLIISVRFDHLVAWDIAAVWGVWLFEEHTPDNDGCKGTVGATGTGPGTWSWDALNQAGYRHLVAKGASYISLPRTLPPDSTNSKWLAMEGIIGLVWGDGKWFMSPRAESLLDGGAAASSTGVTPKSRLKRGLRSPLKGRVWALSPPTSVSPTLVMINGTKYTYGGAGDPVYKDLAGVVLNLTDVVQRLGSQSHW